MERNRFVTIWHGEAIGEGGDSSKLAMPGLWDVCQELRQMCGEAGQSLTDKLLVL